MLLLPLMSPLHKGPLPTKGNSFHRIGQAFQDPPAISETGRDQKLNLRGTILGMDLDGRLNYVTIHPLGYKLHTCCSYIRYLRTAKFQPK